MGLSAPADVRNPITPPSSVTVPQNIVPSDGTTYIDLHAKVDTSQMVLDGMRSHSLDDVDDGKIGTGYSDRIMEQVNPSVRRAAGHPVERSFSSDHVDALKSDPHPEKPDPTHAVLRTVRGISSDNAIAAVQENCGPENDIEKPWKGQGQPSPTTDSKPSYLREDLRTGGVGGYDPRGQGHYWGPTHAHPGR